MELAEKWARIGLDRDYSSLNLDELKPDFQGWGSDHQIFQQVMQIAKPQIVIEIGTWKGASIVNMAKLAERLGLNTQFVCVDTWLGSNDTLWLQEEYRKSLMLKGGYPTMFRQFIRNIVEVGVADSVFPLPMTSSAAYHLLKKLDVRADAIYIDAGHEEDEVKIDLEYYWDLLNDDGILFGDDYDRAWPGVVTAVNAFAAKVGLPVWTTPGKFLIQKK